MRGDFRPLPNIIVQMWDHFFPLLFPKDSESLKILDIRLWEVGAKRPLNGTSKVNTRTDTRTDISTYRKHRPRGPMLWKSWQIIRLSSFAICFLFSKLFGFLAAHISYKSLVVSWSVGWKTLCKEWHIKEYKNIKWCSYLTISGSDYWNHIWVKTSLCLHLLLGGWQRPGSQHYPCVHTYNQVFASAYNVTNAQHQCRQIGAHDSCPCKDIFVSALIVGRLTTSRLPALAMCSYL